MCAYLYKERTLRGSCCVLAEAVSSSTLGLLCFSDGTAAHPSCSGARPPADIYSPSLVDLWTGRRKQKLRHPETSISSSSSRNTARVTFTTGAFMLQNKTKVDKNKTTKRCSKTKGPGLTYSAVAGVTRLSELMWGRQRIPGQQRQVGSRWTILREKEINVKFRQNKTLPGGFTQTSGHATIADSLCSLLSGQHYGCTFQGWSWDKFDHLKVKTEAQPSETLTLLITSSL